MTLIDKKLEEYFIPRIESKNKKINFKNVLTRFHDKYPGANVHKVAKELENLIDDQWNELWTFLKDTEYDLEYEQKSLSGDLYDDAKEESLCGKLL